MKLQNLDQTWIEIKPYGMAFSPAGSRPLLLFRDEKEKMNVPVWVNQLEAGITLVQQEGAAIHGSPHDVTRKIFSSLKIQLERCLFTEVRGHHQFVELHFSGDKRLKPIRTRADEAMSFCLKHNCKFYCKSDFFEACRELKVEMEDVTHQLAQRPGLWRRTTPYMN